MATHVAKNIFPELATPYEVAGREFDAEIEVASNRLWGGQRIPERMTGQLRNVGFFCKL